MVPDVCVVLPLGFTGFGVVDVTVVNDDDDDDDDDDDGDGDDETVSIADRK